jgi:tetratricopeptide (TPR) repeat protein
MTLISPKILLASLTMVCFFQVCFAQSNEKSKPKEKLAAPTVSIVKCDKTTKNAKAEKFCNSGLDLTIQQKFDQAIAAFTKAIELDPKYADAYARRGVAYNWKKENDAAIADFTKAIELTPKRVELYLNRGSIYFVEQKKYELAIADFTKAIELDPKNDFFYRMRARIYDAAGLKDLADADWQKVQELKDKSKQ